MASQFTRVFALPHSLYAEGAPVTIEAGALLKYATGDKIIGQLKFRNLSSEIIKALTVELSFFDPAGAPLEETQTFQYLDLSAKPNTTFGDRTPIPLKDKAARSYQARVVDVVFEDQTRYQADEMPWEPLNATSSPLSAEFDSDMLKQYRIDLCKEAEYQPIHYKDLWRCACGKYNKEGSKCLCGADPEKLFNLNLDTLKSNCEKRMAQEAQEAEEANKRAEKNRKLMTIAALALIPLLILISIVTQNNAEKKAILESETYSAIQNLIDDEVSYYETSYQLTYNHREKTVTLSARKGDTAYSEGSELTPEDYTAFVSIKNHHEKLSKTYYESFEEELGQGINVTIPFYLNDEESPLFTAQNGETIESLLDFAAEKKKMIPLLETEITNLLKAGSYDEADSYILKYTYNPDYEFLSEEEIKEIDEDYILITDSALFGTAEKYAEAMDDYYSTDGANLETVINSLSEVPSDFLDTKSRLATIKKEYDKIKKYSGTYETKEKYPDQIKLKNGKITENSDSSWYSRTYPILQVTDQKTNKKHLAYYSASQKLIISENKVIIESYSKETYYKVK